VYNLGTGVGYSVLDMVKSLEAASGRKVCITLITFEHRDGFASVLLS